MLEKIKRTFTHTIIFSLGALGTKVVGFILLPIYTDRLAPEAYGVLGLLEMVDLLGVHFISFALQNALFRWYTLSNDVLKKKQYVFTIVVFLLVVSSLSFMLVLPFRAFLSYLLFDSPRYGHLLIFTMFSIAFQVISRIQLTLLRIEEKSLVYIKVVISQFVLSLILNIYFVVFLEWKVEGILLAQVISYSVVLLALLPYLIRKMYPGLALEGLKEMLAFSSPMMVAAIAATLLSMGDRFFLTKLASLTSAGLYALGFKLTNVIKVFIIDPFLLGFPIVGWRVVKEDSQPKRYFSKVFTYFVLMLTWLALGISVFSKDIVETFVPNQAYWSGQKVIPFLALGIIMMGIQRALFFILQIPKATKTIPLIVGVSAALNFALNWVLIPKYDFMGAAYANVSAYFFGVGLSYIVAQKHYPIQYELRRLIMLVGIAGILFSITLFLNDFSLLERLLCKGIIVISFPLILYLLNFYEPVEIDRISGSLRKWRKKVMAMFSGVR